MSGLKKKLAFWTGVRNGTSTRAISKSGSHYFGLPRETAGATTRLDMQWLQPPSTPEANGYYTDFICLYYRFFRR
jgi:hypothetical protein